MDVTNLNIIGFVSLGPPMPLGLLTAQSQALLLWGGLAVLTVALLLLMRTQWGQAQPLSKCVALSVLAHGLFVGYAYGTRLFCEIPLAPEEEVLRLDFITNRADDDSDASTATQVQWGMPLAERTPVPDEFHLDRRDASALVDEVERELPEPSEIVAQAGSSDVDELVEELADTPLPESEEDGLATLEDELPPLPSMETNPAPMMAEAAPAPMAEPLVAATPDPPKPELSVSRRRQVDDDPEMSRRDSAERAVAEELLPALVAEAADMQQLADALESLETREARSGEDQLAATSNRETDSAPRSNSEPFDHGPDEPGREMDESSYVAAAAARVTPEQVAMRRVGDGAEFPRVLRARISPERPMLLERHGGNADTEAAVQAALNWLAANQSTDGRWRAKDFGAGQERVVLGHNRHGAGEEGDTGMSGLALLSFLAAGHTHYEGHYRANVQHGLEFLLRSQRSDGNLAGNAELFAAMYCHGLAFLALSEAYAMTGDERLRPYVERAQQYTLAAQVEQDGGWRYQVGDREGDLSQLGWQLMALRSAELAGIPIPERSRRGMKRFLESVAAGRAGGLASYRPGSRPSRTMTAEALACWIFLESPPPQETRREAARFLREELPGNELPNLYYWYYASLALFQLQDDNWEAWNEAMQQQLLRLQRKEGELAGSWDADTVWGGYGGRIYSTAMAALCLEVYYRYLPLYGRTSLAERP